jgi:hypothetical protein
LSELPARKCQLNRIPLISDEASEFRAGDFQEFRKTAEPNPVLPVEDGTEPFREI